MPDDRTAYQRSQTNKAIANALNNPEYAKWGAAKQWAGPNPMDGLHNVIPLSDFQNSRFSVGIGGQKLGGQALIDKWVKHNTHADKYQTDPNYRAEWDASHGGFKNPVQQLFNLGVGGMVGAGLAGEALGVGPLAPSSGGSAAATPAAGSGAPVGGMAGATGAGTVLSPTGAAGVGAAGAAVPAAAGSNALANTATNAASGLDINDALNIGGSVASAGLSHWATEKGIDEIKRQYDINRADMAPWREAGVESLGTYQDRLGEEVPQFEFNLEDDDVYKFQLDQAQKATGRAMAARGMNNSGNVLLELQRNAIGEAGRYQNDAFNRQLGTSQTNYGRDLDRTNQYGSLAGIGQTATNSLALTGTNAANNLSNLYMQQGEGYNNAIQGGINNYLVNRYTKPWRAA